MKNCHWCYGVGCGRCAPVAVPRRRALLLAVPYLVLACAHVDPNVATGETLVATADVFVATNAAMNAAFDAHEVDAVTWGRWLVVHDKFEDVYPHVAALWQAAEKRDDAAERAAATSLLDELRGELAQWTSRTPGPASTSDGGVR